MRTDHQVQQDVTDELQYEPSIDARQIGVSSRNGVVTLSGIVKSYAEKEAAAWRAERVEGVKAVVNEIKVELPKADERSDQDIALAARWALESHVQVPYTKVKIKVERGIITLDGDVHYRYQKLAAENAVRNLMGVRAVVNLINVKPLASPSEVKVQIENALRRAAEIDARRIKVEVSNDKVILRGRVGSWAERSEAERAAWAAPGVREVQDDLTVAA